MHKSLYEANQDLEASETEIIGRALFSFVKTVKKGKKPVKKGSKSGVRRRRVPRRLLGRKWPKTGFFYGYFRAKTIAAKSTNSQNGQNGQITRRFLAKARD